MPQVATMTSETSEGGIITGLTSPKLTINGLQAAILGSEATYSTSPYTAVIDSNVSTKLTIGGIGVAFVGSLTTYPDEVITGQPKLTVSS